MKHSLVKLGAAAALAVGLLAQSLLPAAAGEIQHRIHVQRHRIHAAVRSGQISHRQARGDERRLAHISRERKHDLHQGGGKLTSHRVHHLNHQLNHTSRILNEQSH